MSRNQGLKRPSKNKEINRLVRDFHYNQSDVARWLGVTPMAISKWYTNGDVTITYAVRIQELSGGKYKAVKLSRELARIVKALGLK